MEHARVAAGGVLHCCVLLSLYVLIGGCGSPEGTVIGAAGVTGVGSAMVGQEIQQIYYLGVFDPREQTPSAIFRLTVRGQASVINRTRFACGWVPAAVADSLNTDLSFQNGSIVVASQAERKALGGIETGRRLVLFGPEGFRESPRDHRLVLVMGSNPEEYFSAVRKTLDGIAGIHVDRLDARADQEIISELKSIHDERLQLDALRDDVLRDSMAYQGGK